MDSLRYEYKGIKIYSKYIYNYLEYIDTDVINYNITIKIKNILETILRTTNEIINSFPYNAIDSVAIRNILLEHYVSDYMLNVMIKNKINVNHNINIFNGVFISLYNELNQYIGIIDNEDTSLGDILLNIFLKEIYDDDDNVSTSFYNYVEELDINVKKILIAYVTKRNFIVKNNILILKINIIESL